eukprot:g2369.t1
MIVIEVGTHECRFGHAGADAPQLRVSSQAWFEEGEGVKQKKVQRSRYIFEGLHISPPPQGSRRIRVASQRGVVNDWHVAEALFNDVFQATLPLEGKGAVVVDSTLQARSEQQKFCEVLFEKHGASSVLFTKAPVAGLFAHGRTSGMSVDLGHGGTTVASIENGVIESTERSHMGGELLDEATVAVASLGRRLMQMEEAQALKHSTFRVNPSYTLPDGAPARVEDVPELLFDNRYDLVRGAKPTSLIEKLQEKLIRAEPVPKLIFSAVSKCDLTEERVELVSNTVLFGGTAALPGLQERLAVEIQKVAGSKANIVCCPPEMRRDAAWRGASIIGTLCTTSAPFPILTRQEYMEKGALDALESRFL